ncbi:tautomerase family protein [Streptomyces sp. NPDC052040]|uniref:tautomerase family protein n=1 Tax=unclassified Streptomyces TaxID=2593676 RepID=UPI0037D69670
MPHLQLDVPAHYPTETKRALAKRMGELYAELMQTTPDLVDVTFRELGEGGVWHCGYGDPTPAAVLSLEIRRGRSPEQRERFAEALHELVGEALGLDPLALTIEFTQHAGDEVYKKVLIDGELRGGLGADWTPGETTTPLLDTLRDRARTPQG